MAEKSRPLDVRAAVAARIEPLPKVDPDGLAPLTLEERERVVDSFLRVLEQVYTHLPQKRATYGKDPVQRLRLLRQGLDRLSGAAFNEAIAGILTDLRDGHTRYLGPAVLEGQIAFLPFLVEHFVENAQDRFVVSKIFARSDAEKRAWQRQGFVNGVEVTHWNGVPIARAVDRHADQETGGRPDARRARTIESLTLHPLRYGLLPDAEWVVLSFVGGGKAGEVKIPWRQLRLDPEPPVPANQAARRALALNPVGEQARRAKKMLFARDAWREAAARALPSLKESAGAFARGERQWMTGRFQDNVAARRLATKHGEFGHLRIWSFDLLDDTAFVQEVIELLDELPREGLVIDLRGNPGGLIWAAERLLQLFTPHDIQPTRFSLLATDVTRAMARAPQGRREFEPWRRSLDEAVVNGERYTRDAPLTPVARCNDLGQHYPGPCVAVVDANTFSAGDLFAAGFVDNQVGTLISTDDATGGGGANIWTPDLIAQSVVGTEHALPPLPGGIAYTVAFRRAVRVRQMAGAVIEDVGIAGHVRRPLTRRDLTQDNEDLLAFCARFLASERRTDLRLDTGADRLLVHTQGLDQIDVNIDGRPRHSIEFEQARGHEGHRIPLESGWSELIVEGYEGDLLRQRRRRTYSYRSC